MRLKSFPSFALMLAAFWMTAASLTGAQNVQARLWVVPYAQAAEVTFPVPSVQEDVHFQANGIAYIGSGTASGEDHCVTIGSLLADCSTPLQPVHGVAGLMFTGYVNPNLGNTTAKTTTRMNSRLYGELIEFKGTLSLTTNEQVRILHDDGVMLQFSGSGCVAPNPPVCSRSGQHNCFSNGITAPILEGWTYKGANTTCNYDLLYGNIANDRSDGVWILFFPQLF